MQYKYKSARKVIKYAFKVKRSLLGIYDNEDYLITELRKRIIKTHPERVEQVIDACNGTIKEMYEVLNNPKRYQSRPKLPNHAQT